MAGKNIKLKKPDKPCKECFFACKVGKPWIIFSTGIKIIGCQKHITEVVAHLSENGKSD